MDTGLSLLRLIVGRETASIMAETGNSAEEKRHSKGCVTVIIDPPSNADTCGCTLPTATLAK